ncbi:hypothetical protein RHSIM_Rhsim07G0116900 [Rhododendron simsii]|uniref:non-specific serine/threonine protein kinase n=1 Tax=Rhododendron simsii TaxID=118357 RepID=A0A834GQY9_RHOSS|nr:hypothetical protein RHSIM_Rhsim07G0116900 [Rhododendron simsii]
MASSAIPPLIIFLSLLPFLPLFAASNVPLGSSPAATSDNSSLVDKGASNPAEDLYDLNEVPNINFLFGDNEKLQNATKGFKEELERDSFGIVYKGVVKYGSKTQVAIKKLDKLSQGRDTEFKAEVNAIGRTHHNNLVQLLGCCYEGTHRLLMYEFMSNGSLADFLFGIPRPDWYHRVQLALGIARGLLEVTSSLASSALSPLILLSLLPFLPLYAASNVTLGSSLSTTSDNPYSWVSPSGDFAFGFRQLNNTDIFLLAIWEYAYPKSSVGNESWSVDGYIPENICADLITNDLGSGACGYNSYCMANGSTSYELPTCHCPPGFSFIDPNNDYGGCAPDFPQDCGVDNGASNPEDLYEMIEVQNINFPFGDYDSLGPYNLTQCEQACLQGCNCLVAIFNGILCWKKRLPMSNGVQQTAMAIFKVRKHSVDNTTLLELKKATDGFKEELGSGSFGIVYKGVLKYGSKTQVAVKKLDKLSQGQDREFKAEVTAIGRTHHKNLVQLLGYCHEGTHMLLVFGESVAQEFEDEERAILTDWAYDCFGEGTLDALVENDDTAMNDIETLPRWVMTAIWCVQKDPLQRPAMSIVLQMLEGYVEVPSPI